MKRILIALVLLAAPAIASAQERYALLVEGTSGTPEYAEQHRKWLDDLAKVLHDRMEFDAAHMIVLAETPKGAELPATADSVRAAFKNLAGKVHAGDLLFVMLIGHGTSSAGGEAKFNLVGPDLAIGDWVSLVNAVPGHLVFVDGTSQSDSFLKALAAPGRVVVVATVSPAMRYDSLFPQAFIEALQSPEADLDKNGRTSIWEAFTFAARAVLRYYEAEGLLPTERAALDDDADGLGREAAGAGKDGSLAGMTYLDPAPETKTNDPELKRLLQQQTLLTQQVQALKQKQSTMTPEDYAKELERLTTELAIVSRDIRKKGGG